LSTRQYYDKKHENLDTPFKESSIPLGLSAADVLRCISDEKVLSIFRAVALSENDDNGILITKLRLSRKQYYTRMEILIHTGLVKRTNGKYRLTSFGKVIFSAQQKVEAEIETAIKHYWELKAVDSIMMMMSTYDKELLQERQRIIDKLIDNQEIKDILFSNMLGPQFYTSAGQQQEQMHQSKQESLVH
jgi:predicted transcriptional regulator